ncbi:hypothetical protein [Mycolicibacter sinensis]|uniref:hypothetical protein n=1 Tax=Mycolicibacter sinensis (strain JDM601) TaxID=875328 RepID=UPI0007EAF35F|nr:hypothetical protein [Mycolicibacter sinensis]OBH19938.1 hypothetical protein A5694_01160 [Mycolicibacter sinensis]
MDIPAAAKRGRVNAAGCRWDTTLAQPSLDDLHVADRGAWAKLVALIADSEQYGLPFDANGYDYSAPVGERVRSATFRGRSVPWLGELRVEERTPQRASRLGDAAQYRLYFGEPNDPPDLVLGLSIGQKRGRDRDAGRKQTRQMIDAMWKLIRWCESRTPKTGWRERAQKV